MSWIFWVALALILVIFFVKFKEFRHRFGSFFLIAAIVFFVASIYYVYSSQNIDVSNFDGIMKGANAYFSWLGASFKNIGQITGFAVRQDWGTNSTAIG